ncbi:dihydrodipicolinate synthase family protein [Streptomyces olivaceus]|uniref:dihydrodipicolinate synthase family protein n=1 Tax=Streptomyces TaxID=1883 RepID=UPI001FB70806|nr:dihydrodipicolinate synthase family protein [Streptomyces sp. CB09030]UOG81600.1 dihydrodipicolinate synthase family protein [Streptomyces sp. CB09030]
MHRAQVDYEQALAGVVAIPVTPFDTAGGVDRAAYRALVRRLLDGGVRTVTPGGNTGEFYALDESERLLVVELAVAEATASGHDAHVVAGVGLDVATAVREARRAGAAGAGLVMIHQPVHPYVSEEGWVEYHRAVADAVPDLGVVLYVRDPLLAARAIRRLGELCANVVGVKYAVPDAARFAAVSRDAGPERFVWIAGLAELYAPAYWAMGATGFTSGLANVAPHLSLELLAVLRDGDFGAASAVRERVRSFEELRAERGSADNVSVVKEALAQLGHCRRDVRPPSHPLDGERRRRVRDAVADWKAC